MLAIRRRLSSIIDLTADCAGARDLSACLQEAARCVGADSSVPINRTDWAAEFGREPSYLHVVRCPDDWIDESLRVTSGGRLYLYLNKDTLASSATRLSSEASGAVQLPAEFITVRENSDATTSRSVHIYMFVGDRPDSPRIARNQ